MHDALTKLKCLKSMSFALKGFQGLQFLLKRCKIIPPVVEAPTPVECRLERPPKLRNASALCQLRAV